MVQVSGSFLGDFAFVLEGSRLVLECSKMVVVVSGLVLDGSGFSSGRLWAGSGLVLICSRDSSGGLWVGSVAFWDGSGLALGGCGLACSTGCFGGHCFAIRTSRLTGHLTPT